MITIQLNDKGIKVRGHSNHAKHGHDIVCAAVSVLVPTLANTLKMNDIEVNVIEHKSGRAILGFPNLSPKGENILAGFCFTFKDLAEQYPNNVEFIDERSI